MIAALQQIISYLCHTAFTVMGMILLLIALSVVSSFLLVIVTLGTASTGAYALARQWDRRRERPGGVRERPRRHSLPGAKWKTRGTARS